MEYNYSETTNTYEKILKGEQKSFSPYFFQKQYRNERVIELVKYLLEEKLKITPQEALDKLTFEVLEENQLDCLDKYVDKPVEFLKDNVTHLVYFAYPELEFPNDDELALMVYQDVLDEKRRTFPRNYFLNGAIGERRAVVCFRYLCENILELTEQEIIDTFSISKGLKVLSEYKLKIIMNVLFYSNIDLLESCYPGIF